MLTCVAGEWKLALFRVTPENLWFVLEVMYLKAFVTLNIILLLRTTENPIDLLLFQVYLVRELSSERRFLCICFVCIIYEMYVCLHNHLFILLEFLHNATYWKLINIIMMIWTNFMLSNKLNNGIFLSKYVSNKWLIFVKISSYLWSNVFYFWHWSGSNLTRVKLLSKMIAE